MGFKLKVFLLPCAGERADVFCFNFIGKDFGRPGPIK